MQKAQASIEIKAPVHRVYDFLSQPRNLPSIWPSMVEVSNVVDGPSGGHDFDWIYKMAGVRLKGHSRTVEAQPGKLLRTREEGGISSTFRWTFQGLNGAGTRVTCEVEYAMPLPVIGRLAEALVAKLNKRELETTFANLKEVMEHGDVGDATAAAVR